MYLGFLLEISQIQSIRVNFSKSILFILNFDYFIING